MTVVWVQTEVTSPNWALKLPSTVSSAKATEAIHAYKKLYQPIASPWRIQLFMVWWGKEERRTSFIHLFGMACMWSSICKKILLWTTGEVYEESACLLYMSWSCLDSNSHKWGPRELCEELCNHLSLSSHACQTASTVHSEWANEFTSVTAHFWVCYLTRCRKLSVRRKLVTCLLRTEKHRKEQSKESWGPEREILMIQSLPAGRGKEFCKEGLQRTSLCQ